MTITTLSSRDFNQAVSQANRMRVVTRNVGDFLPLGVDLLNPWS